MYLQSDENTSEEYFGCITSSEEQYACERDAARWGWGVGGWYYPMLRGVPSPDTLQLCVGDSVDSKGSALHHGVWALLAWDWLIVELRHRKGGGGGSVAASVLFTQRPMCIPPSSSMPSPRRQAEGPCDATHSWVQCMAGLALTPVVGVGWAQILEAGTGWEQGLSMGGGGRESSLALPLSAAEASKTGTVL